MRKYKFNPFKKDVHDNNDLNDLLSELKVNARETRNEYYRLSEAFEHLQTLYDEKIKSENLFRSLGNISLILLRNLEVESNLYEICRSIGISASVDRCFVFKHTEDEKFANVLTEWTDTNQCLPTEECGGITEYDYSKSQWMRDKLIKDRETIFGATENLLDEKLKESLQNQSVQATIISPILTNGHCWGFLGLHSIKERREWTESERNVLETITNMIGTAIQRLEKREKTNESSAG